MSSFAATTGASAANSGIESFLPLVLFVVVLYVLMIYPQQKKQKKLAAMLSKLAVGDEVLTIGGVLGKIVAIEDSYLKVEIGKGLVITIQRSAVGTPLPNGTLKF